MTKKQYISYGSVKYNLNREEQLLMIYDGIISQLLRVIESIKNKNYEDIFNLTNKSYMIVISLIECLDFNKGKDTAKALYNFYSNISQQILYIQNEYDINTCNKVISNLKKLRSAWESSFKSLNNKSKDQEIINLSKNIQIDI